MSLDLPLDPHCEAAESNERHHMFIFRVYFLNELSCGYLTMSMCMTYPDHAVVCGWNREMFSPRYTRWNPTGTNSVHTLLVAV
jgi:hypothetical protein